MYIVLAPSYSERASTDCKTVHKLADKNAVMTFFRGYNGPIHQLQVFAATAIKVDFTIGGIEDAAV